MKRFTGICTMMLCALCLLTIPSLAQQTSKMTSGQKFAFRYEANQPLLYSMGMKMKMDMDIEAGEENVTMKTVIDLRYRVKLTPIADPKDGVTTMRLELSNIEGDWDIASPGGHIVMSLRGSQMKGTRDGVTIIDTEKDIGFADAQEFKKEILPLYLSGQVDMDTMGNVREFRGDLPFVEFWTETLGSQIGFLGVVFPERAVAIGDTWTETLTLKKMGQVKLEGEGLRCTATFTRCPDITAQGKRLAVFSLSAPFSYKDLTGYMEQMGQSTRLNISHFDRTASGTLRFDQDQGVLTDETMTIDANGSMNAFIEGQSMTMNLILGAEMSIERDIGDIGGISKPQEADKTFSKTPSPTVTSTLISTSTPTSTLTAPSTFAIAQPQQDLGEIIVKESIANIRTGPGTQYSIVTKSYKGDKLAIISKSGSWYQVKLSDEKTGWIYANLVQQTTVTTTQKIEQEEEISKKQQTEELSTPQQSLPILKDKPIIFQSLPDILNEKVEIIIEKREKVEVLKIGWWIPPNTKYEMGGFVYESASNSEAAGLEKEFENQNIGKELDAEIIKIAPNLTINISSTESIECNLFQ